MLTHTLTLPCGLRIIHAPSESPVVYCGIVIRAGTRDEEPADSGMAHFIEHMAFKGTERLTARRISNALERRGGDLNAFTNKQETVFHATCLLPEFIRAAGLLTDIVFHSTYPQREIDREVEVICDEIDSYRDTPSELIFDDFEARLFTGHPLGRDILGDAECLRSYTTADARRFADRYYLPSNAVFFVLGGPSWGRIRASLERLYADFPLSEPRPVATPAATLPPLSSDTVLVKKDTHQAHVMLGARALSGTDPQRYAMMLLNNLLGGPGMNSRLNISLRERRGLVYSIDSYATMYVDAGLWNVYFGCDPDDVERCRRLVMRELERLATAPLSVSQFSAAVNQLCGQVLISTDSSENLALAMGKSFAHYGAFQPPADLCAALRDLTPADLFDVARRVYDPDHILTLVYTGEEA